MVVLFFSIFFYFFYFFTFNIEALSTTVRYLVPEISDVRTGTN